MILQCTESLSVVFSEEISARTRACIRNSSPFYSRRTVTGRPQRSSQSWQKEELSFSNIAYQCAKLADPDESESLREWIINTEFGDFDLPRPDLNIFLDVPIGFVEKSLEKGRNGSDRNYLHGSQDIHEASIEFQKRVRDIYKRQASLDPDFIPVDCSGEDGGMLPPDEIFAKIKVLTDTYLTGR